MEISLKWINELIDIKDIPLEKLIEKMTLGGFEVEDIIERTINNELQLALDISATANRSDSLSIYGLTNEIAALVDRPFKDAKYLKSNSNWEDNFIDQPKYLTKTNDCQTFFAITVENIEDLTSPKWLQQKLIQSGIVPEKNFRDFQTYIQLETGYPFEFYDLDKISKILAKPKVNNFALNLSTTKFKKNLLADNTLIGIAGIIPDEKVCCSNMTNKILIEGSIFAAATIRKQSRLLGIRTERSARYEKAIKDSDLIPGCYRLLSLLRIKNPNLVCKLHTNTQTQPSALSILNLKYETVKQILGPINSPKLQKLNFISPEQVTSYLKRLNFKLEYKPKDQTWFVTIPDLRRNDIIEEIDLIEEIGRLHGFDHFLTQVPEIGKFGIEDISYKARKRLTAGFLSFGLTEFVHYSLVNRDFPASNVVSLINPLLSEYADLRVSLLPNLLNTLTTNIKQGNTLVEGFEYGHVFSEKVPQIIQEKEVVAGLLGSGEFKSTRSVSGKPLSWFEAKGRLEELFEKLSMVVNWEPHVVNEKSVIFHPYRTSKIFVNQTQELGLFGQINPILAKKLNIPNTIYLFEWNFDIIKKCLTKTNMAVLRDYSLYPRIIKDLSFIVSTDVGFEKIKETIYLNGTSFLIKVKLLDEYRGNGIPDSHTSLCLQFTFQSMKQTLQTQQVENILTNLKEILKKKFNIIIRD